MKKVNSLTEILAGHSLATFGGYDSTKPIQVKKMEEALYDQPAPTEFIAGYDNPIVNRDEVRFLGEEQYNPAPRLYVDALVSANGSESLNVRFQFDSGCDFPLVITPAICEQLGSVMVVDQQSATQANGEEEPINLALVRLTVSGRIFLTHACIMETDQPLIGNFLANYFDIRLEDDQFVITPLDEKIQTLPKVK